MAIHLGRLLPDASSNQPGRRCENAFRSGETPPLCRPYSVLLPAGFTLPRLLPAARCALTAPFHPYPFDGLVLDAFRPQVAQSAVGQQKGGLLSVALSLGSPPPDVIRRRVSVEPGLSSTWRPCFNRERPQRTSPKQRPSGQLAPHVRAFPCIPSRASRRNAGNFSSLRVTFSRIFSRSGAFSRIFLRERC